MPLRKPRKLNNTVGPHQMPLALDLGPLATLGALKAKEAEFRSASALHTDHPIRPDLPTLILPRRYEALEAEAKVHGVPLRPLVRPVRQALDDIEQEIRLVRETAMGRLYVISGVTGSGKTTFLKSLSLFIDGIQVFDIKGVALDHRGSVEGALALLQRDSSKISVVVLEGREAPASLRNEELDVLLTTLNLDFRADSGRKTLFVIPTTSSSLAQSISKQAALIGGMTRRDRPFFIFDGPSRNQYLPITNETLMAFNEAKTLLDYGMPDDLGKGIAEASASIGEFIENCHHEITSRQNLLAKNAAEVRHKRIHLWMVFCSFEEDLRRNHDIVRSLTVGDKQRVQVPRILAGDSREIREWQMRPAEFAQASSYLDLRILYLPMRTALAVITAYAPSELLIDLKKQKLLQRETVRDRAKESLANTALGTFLRQQGFVDDPSRRGRLEPRQKAQFLEIMKIAVNDETILNSMIADALRELNTDPETIIVTEKELNEQRTLLSDIAVITPTDIFCLEMKWRSSMLQGSEVMRESVSRVTDFVKNLPELKHLFL